MNRRHFSFLIGKLFGAAVVGCELVLPSIARSSPLAPGTWRVPRKCLWLGKTGDYADPRNWRNGLVPDYDSGDTAIIESGRMMIGDNDKVSKLVLLGGQMDAAIIRGAKIDNLVVCGGSVGRLA